MLMVTKRARLFESPTSQYGNVALSRLDKKQNMSGIYGRGPVVR